jgi:DNA-binding transcriptional LysR family regulator
MKRKIASVVPGFPTALSVALASDLIAMVPALYLLNQAMTERVHVFELPFKTRTITVSQMWHPRMERIRRIAGSGKGPGGVSAVC